MKEYFDEEKIKALFEKYGFTYTGKRSYAVYLGYANRFGFNGDTNLEKLENYLSSKNKIVSDRIALCEKYDKVYSIKQWENYKMLARSNGFINNNDLKLIGEYFKFSKNQIEKHKNIMAKYGVSYINEYSWSNFIRTIQKAGFDENSIDEYYDFKNKKYEKKRQIEKKQKELYKLSQESKQKELFYKYEIDYIGYESFHQNLVWASRLGFSSGDNYKDLEDYFKFKQMQKSKKARKVIKSLFLKIIGKSGMNFDKIMSNVRTAGFKTNNPFKDLVDWINWNEQIEKKKIKEKKKRKDRIMTLLNKYNATEISHNILLSTARNFGFKTDNDFEDMENYLKYRQIKIDKIKQQHKIKQLEKQKEIERIRDLFSVNNTPLDIEKISDLKKEYEGCPGVLFLWGKRINNNCNDNNCDKFQCLTGGQTKDLYSHILLFKRYADKTKNQTL